MASAMPMVASAMPMVHSWHRHGQPLNCARQARLSRRTAEGTRTPGSSTCTCPMHSPFSHVYAHVHTYAYTHAHAHAHAHARTNARAHCPVRTPVRMSARTAGTRVYNTYVSITHVDGYVHMHTYVRTDPPRIVVVLITNMLVIIAHMSARTRLASSWYLSTACR